MRSLEGKKAKISLDRIWAIFTLAHYNKEFFMHDIQRGGMNFAKKNIGQKASRKLLVIDFMYGLTVCFNGVFH